MLLANVVEAARGGDEGVMIPLSTDASPAIWENGFV
jgi:hypothetical protein